MSWRVAASLLVLQSQVNVQWPNRSTASDGTIGDTSHAATASDHNPNPQGVVCAFDLTHDPAAGVNCDAIAESVRLNPHPDLKYVIWSRRIYSAYEHNGIPPFTWRPYSGADPHTSHIHFSVGVGRDGQSTPPYDDTMPWQIFSAQDTPATLPSTPPKEIDEMFIILRPGVAILAANQKLTVLRPKTLYSLAAKGVIQIDLTADDADDQAQMASFQHQFGEPA